MPGRPGGVSALRLPAVGKASELPRGLSRRLAAWESEGWGACLPLSSGLVPRPLYGPGRDSDLGGGVRPRGALGHARIAVSALVSASLSRDGTFPKLVSAFPSRPPQVSHLCLWPSGLSRAFSVSVPDVSVWLRFSPLPFPFVPRSRPLHVPVLGSVPSSPFPGRPGSPSVWRVPGRLARTDLPAPPLPVQRPAGGGACAPSGAQGAELRAAPPPRVPARAPPTAPRPQSRRCRPMNGVAFCLVGIPPRSEPRPPQVRRSARGGVVRALPGLAVGPGRGAPARRAQRRAQGAGTAGTAAGDAGRRGPGGRRGRGAERELPWAGGGAGGR